MLSPCTCRAVGLNSGYTLETHGSWRNVMLRTERLEIPAQLLRVGHRCVFPAAQAIVEWRWSWHLLMWAHRASLPLSLIDQFPTFTCGLFSSYLQRAGQTLLLSFIIIFLTNWFFSSVFPLLRPGLARKLLAQCNPLNPCPSFDCCLHFNCESHSTRKTFCF